MIDKGILKDFLKNHKIHEKYSTVTQLCRTNCSCGYFNSEPHDLMIDAQDEYYEHLSEKLEELLSYETV